MSDLTYQEPVLRFRILRHEEYNEERKECLRQHGIDPDDNWALIWSFHKKEDAEEQLAEMMKTKPTFWTYKIVDGGETTVITRPIY